MKTFGLEVKKLQVLDIYLLYYFGLFNNLSYKDITFSKTYDSVLLTYYELLEYYINFADLFVLE